MKNKWIVYRSADFVTREAEINTYRGNQEELIWKKIKGFIYLGNIFRNPMNQVMESVFILIFPF